MALPGETVSTGAPLPYPGARIQVCMSGAGYYLGFLDYDQSPYSRESRDYYATSELAMEALLNNTWEAR